MCDCCGLLVIQVLLFRYKCFMTVLMFSLLTFCFDYFLTDLICRFLFAAFINAFPHPKKFKAALLTFNVILFDILI